MNDHLLFYSVLLRTYIKGFLWSLCACKIWCCRKWNMFFELFLNTIILFTNRDNCAKNTKYRVSKHFDFFFGPIFWSLHDGIPVFPSFHSSFLFMFIFKSSTIIIFYRGINHSIFFSNEIWKSLTKICHLLFHRI